MVVQTEIPVPNSADHGTTTPGKPHNDHPHPHLHLHLRPPFLSRTDSSLPPMASPRPSPAAAVPVPVSVSVRRQKQRSDVFKPRFPLDPFASTAGPLGDPWFLKVDALLACANHQRRDVILVLGAPSLTDLSPVLQSRHLALSLVILATHAPPDIPHLVVPTVRILHLSSPLALEDSGAVRFVNVLEWAERVARTWRKYGGSGVEDLTEDHDMHDLLTPPSPIRFRSSHSTPPSPRSSVLQLPVDTPSSSLSSRPTSTSLRFLSTKSRLPPSDPTQRPFDALLNFLPSGVPDKSLLKHSILVTTISRPFLVSTAPPQSRTRSASASSMCPSSLRPSQPLSIFSSIGALGRSASSVYLPPTSACGSGESLYSSPAPPRKALLVHLLTPAPQRSPDAHARLVRSVEAFLVSFAFPPTLAASAHPHGDGPDGLARARPYVMSAGTFSGAVTCEPGVADQLGEWTVADLVLCGALDAEGAPRPGKAPRRAWVGGATDVVMLPAVDEFGVERAGEGGATLRVPPDVLNGLPTPPYSDESSEGAYGEGEGAVVVGGTKRKISWRFWRRRKSGAPRVEITVL